MPHYLATIRLVLRATDLEQAHEMAAMAVNHGLLLVEGRTVQHLSTAVEFSEPLAQSAPAHYGR